MADTVVSSVISRYEKILVPRGGYNLAGATSTRYIKGDKRECVLAIHRHRQDDTATRQIQRSNASNIPIVTNKKKAPKMRLIMATLLMRATLVCVCPLLILP